MRKLPVLIMLITMIICIVLLLTSPISSLFLMGFGFTMTLLFILWIVSLLIKDSSIIDIYWGFGYVAMVWFYFYYSGFDFTNIRNVVFCSIVSIWGLRLSFYIGARNIGQPEDYRYQQFRKQGGKNYWWISFLRVFLLQGILLWIISSSFPFALSAGVVSLSILDYIGIALWTIGFLFEAVGDWQLSTFKKDPANQGKVMDKGLWKFTRHPNYFGDALLWWGFFLFALAHPHGWHHFFSPLLMTFLLMRVSGVVLLEKKLVTSKPKYKEYMEKTSAFFPMFPKK